MESETVRANCPSNWRPLVSALALACACGNALADDPNPYYVGVSQAFTHDSNVYRLPDNVQGDTYSSTGLLAGIDQPFGRQHFTASGNIRYNRFNHLNELNNTSYGLNAALDWSTIERLSGTVSMALSQNLATYGVTNQLQLQKKNVETDSQYLARAQLGLVSLLSLEGVLIHRGISYSAPEYALYESTQDVASLGLKYRPSGLLTLGSALRYTHGSYPHGSTGTFDREDLDLTALWQPNGLSTLNARISFGRQRYNNASESDFSGTTGAITWAYRPTGKLSFTTTLIRDTGLQSSFVTFGTTNGQVLTAIGDNSRLSTTLSLDGTYAATGKISVNAGARYVHRSLTNALAPTSGESLGSISGSDNVKTAYIGLTYVPLRSLQLACNVSHDSRTVSAGTSDILTYPYSSNSVGCSAQFTLQ